MNTFKVSHHGGALCALVKAETPERAIEICKAHREAKRLWSRKPPQSVLSDSYDVEQASRRDIAWARRFRVGALTDVPGKPRKGAVRPCKRLGGTRGRATATDHAGGQFCEAA